MTKIGFIGLGHMGLPMATQLVRAGYEVTGYDIQESALQQFTKAGGLASSQLSDLTNQDLYITMLQKGEQVKQICLGSEGLFAAVGKDTLFIDCSSIDVSTARELHLKAKEYGLRYVDAPVSGGVAGASAGTLTFMVGGDREAYEEALTVLAFMGKKMIHTGGAASGQIAKICNNMILGISMIAISEAFILAEQLGLPAQQLFEVVTNASGQCWAMSQYVPVPGILEKVPANNDYKPGFAAAMMLKDLLLSQNAAESVKLKTALGEKATALYQHFIDQGYGDLDFSAIIKMIAAAKEV